MDAKELKQCIDRLEQCADDAKSAMQAGSATSELRDCVNTLHQQASQAKQAAGPQADERKLRDTLMQLEQTADRAMQACRNAGSQVDAKTQQAVQQAHAEASKAKKQIQADSPA
jgi:hypothetical protein